jgi:probable HAF family extracellular repeat protein
MLGDKMNRNLATATMIFAVLTLTALAVAQDQAAALPDGYHHPRYRLVDLGTFGGPASYFPNGLDGILNNHGVSVGWANTSTHDPLDPLCVTPTCFLTHAFEARDGVLNDLGALPTGSDSQAVWISGNKLIAGVADNGELDPLVPGFTELRGVLWRDGQIVDLGTLPDGGFESIANAVNDRGQVVGFALNTVPDPFSFVGFPTQTRAFLWQDGNMQDLGTLGGPDALANFINNRGDVSGPSYTPIDPVTGAPAAVHPFLWRKGHKMIDLGSLGGTDSEPTAMNASGDVVGLSTLSGDLIQHPFLWRRGKLMDLGTLGGDNGTTNWINNRGDIAGKGDLAGPAPQLHDATLWRNGKIVDLGVLPGDSCSNAYYVNSYGQVVGTSENLDLCLIPTGQHAFLWEKDGPMLDLNNLIPPGADLELTFAVAINDRGEIAGFGVPPGCAPEDIELCGHAYLLLPCRAEADCTNQSLPGASTSVPIPNLVRPPRDGSQTESVNPQERPRNSLKWRLHLRPSNGSHVPEPAAVPPPGTRASVADQPRWQTEDALETRELEEILPASSSSSGATRPANSCPAVRCSQNHTAGTVCGAKLCRIPGVVQPIWRAFDKTYNRTCFYGC